MKLQDLQHSHTVRLKTSSRFTCEAQKGTNKADQWLLGTDALTFKSCSFEGELNIFLLEPALTSMF